MNKIPYSVRLGVCSVLMAFGVVNFGLQIKLMFWFNNKLNLILYDIDMRYL